MYYALVVFDRLHEFSYNEIIENFQLVSRIVK